MLTLKKTTIKSKFEVLQAVLSFILIFVFALIQPGLACCNQDLFYKVDWPPRAHIEKQVHTIITTGHLELPLNLADMFLDCGREVEYPEKKIQTSANH